jgi:ubiquinone/menaquinone biosynthesis C-methylase UbiE
LRFFALIYGVAIAAAVGGVPMLAQEHPHAANQARHDEITDTAKKLNEAFGADADKAAEGFESAGRALFDKRFAVINILGLKPGMDVADIGAGSGLFSRLMAPLVAPGGTVYAVEIAQGLVDHIARTAEESKLDNIKAILGDPRSPRLAAGSVDVVFIADSYHHFEYPREMLAEIKKALRPQGFVLLVDFERIEGVSHPFVLNMVRAGKGAMTDEFRDAGFEPVQEFVMFDDEYVLKFKHREALR